MLKKTIKTAESNAGKWVLDQTEIFRLNGTLCYHIGREKQAIQWWERAIKTGTRLNAHLEVNKTTVEMERLAGRSTKEKRL